MSPEGSPLDLNHLPDDFNRDGKQDFEDTFNSGQRRKKNNGKDESGRVYECRFCSLKFCKSQALGGHMNRHRQERETETLNKARQLVYSSDQNLAAHPLSTLGSYVAPGATAYPAPPPPHQVYPTRPLMYSPPSSSTAIQPPRQQYPHHHHQSRVYTSSTTPRLGGDYYMAHGHSLPGSSYFYNDTANYTCVGAPVGVPGLGSARRDGSDRDEVGLLTGSLPRTYMTGSNLGSDHHHQHHLDSPY